MPRIVAGSDARGSGVQVPGVFAALLAAERARYERRGGEPLVIDGVEIGKKSTAGVDEHGKQRFFLYPRRDLLNSLEAAAEAGRGVTVSRGRVETALWERDRDGHPHRVRLPFGSDVRRVQVLPDDRVTPADRKAEVR